MNARQAVMDAPVLLLRAAVHAASRTADSLKVKKSTLRAQTVLARLQREIEQGVRSVRGS